MRKPQHDKRHRQGKQGSKRTIVLSLETLEPRLVLSAAGFGFDGTRGQLDLRDRHHGDREANRPALVEPFLDKSVTRFELANRPESNLPKPVRDGHPRGGRPNEPIPAISPEPRGHGSRFHARPGRPPVNLAGGEGESTVPTHGLDGLSSSGSVANNYEPTLYAGTAILSTTVVFASLTPTSSPTRDNDLLNLERPATRLTQPPRTAFNDSVIPRTGSAATLPVSLPVSSLASSRTSPIVTTVESPRIRFESASPDSAAVSIQPASESTKITAMGNETFVSLASNDLATDWNVDGESFEVALTSSDPLTESIRPAEAVGQAVASWTALAEDRQAGLAEKSLWASVSEGGFIDIDTDVGDDARERFEFAEDSEDVSGSKRLSTNTSQDAFWFDFGDPRLDLICESFAAEESAEEQALDNVADADEEAWLLDDGGMIVLTSSRVIDQADEMAVVDTSDASSTGGASSTGEPASAETEIPMDAGIGVFQAIEVAAAPVEQQDSAAQATGDTPALIEGDEAADADQAIPAVEQAAKSRSDGDKSEPVRTASLPLLLAISTLISHGRKIKKKVTNRRREA